jgi:2-dehydro-3-deoxy-D-arabinonate dehydratase
VQLIRYQSTAGVIAVALAADDQLIAYLPTPELPLCELLHMRLDSLREFIEQGIRLTVYHKEQFDSVVQRVLAPVDGATEVWSAGMTYKRPGRVKRGESSSSGGDIYARVYKASRPGLFFKANARRVAGPESPVVMRTDSSLNVSEAGLVAVVNCYAEVVGYTIGNTMNAQSLTEENPLYLSQAQVYSGCCALGPGITPAWEVSHPSKLKIAMTIERDKQKVWKGETSTRELRRKLDDLIAYLFREDDFPDGVFLSTGVALMPEPSFILQAGDIIEITIGGLGTLRNPVVEGKSALVAPVCPQGPTPLE